MERHFLKIHLNIIVPSTLESSNWTLSLRFPHKNLAYVSPSPYVLHTPPVSFFSVLSSETLFGEEYRSLSSSLRSCLHSSVTSSLLCQNILLSTLFSGTLSLHSSLNVSDQVSHPYKTTGKIVVLYIFYHSVICVAKSCHNELR